MHRVSLSRLHLTVEIDQLTQKSSSVLCGFGGVFFLQVNRKDIYYKNWNVQNESRKQTK